MFPSPVSSLRSVDSHTSSELRAISWFQRPSLNPPPRKLTTPVPSLTWIAQRFLCWPENCLLQARWVKGTLQSVEGKNGPNCSDVMPSCPVHVWKPLYCIISLISPLDHLCSVLSVLTAVIRVTVASLSARLTPYSDDLLWLVSAWFYVLHCNCHMID